MTTFGAISVQFMVFFSQGNDCLQLWHFLLF